MQRPPDMPDHRLFRRLSVRIRIRGQLYLEPFDVKSEAEGGHVPSAGHPPDRTLLGLGLEVSGYMAAARSRDQPLDLPYLAVGRTDGQFPGVEVPHAFGLPGGPERLELG